MIYSRAAAFDFNCFLLLLFYFPLHDLQPHECENFFTLRSSLLHGELIPSSSLPLRDGPLENLWGGGRSKYKKKFAQGKI